MNILEEAQAVIKERQARYGSPKEDFQRIAGAARAMFGWDIHDWQVPLLMNLVKVSRATEGYHRDNAVDGCGYWQCYEQTAGPDAMKQEALEKIRALHIASERRDAGMGLQSIQDIILSAPEYQGIADEIRRDLEGDGWFSDMAVTDKNIAGEGSLPAAEA